MSFDPFGDFETAGYLQNSLQLKMSIEYALKLAADKKRFRDQMSTMVGPPYCGSYG